MFVNEMFSKVKWTYLAKRTWTTFVFVQYVHTRLTWMAIGSFDTYAFVVIFVFLHFFYFWLVSLQLCHKIVNLFFLFLIRMLKSVKILLDSVQLLFKPDLLWVESLNQLLGVTEAVLVVVKLPSYWFKLLFKLHHFIEVFLGFFPVRVCLIPLRAQIVL